LKSNTNVEINLILIYFTTICPIENSVVPEKVTSDSCPETEPNTTTVESDLSPEMTGPRLLTSPLSVDSRLA